MRICVAGQSGSIWLQLQSNTWKKKKVSREFQYSWQLFSSSAILYVSLPVFKVGPRMCVRVDISQKIYPIITDSYHYHFLRLCSPSVRLIESANVNILFKYQCNLTICPASKNSTTDKLDRQLIRAGEDRRPKTPFTLTVHLFP